MKTFSYTIILLVLCIQANAQQPSFTREWVLDINTTLEQMPQPERAKYDSLSQALRTAAQNNMNGREYAIHSDSTVTILWKSKSGSHTSEGTWKYSEAHNKLRFTVDGLHAWFTVVELTEEHLVLQQENHGSLFRTLYFNRKEQ